jgi:hypothetical protein
MVFANVIKYVLVCVAIIVDYVVTILDAVIVVDAESVIVEEEVFGHVAIIIVCVMDIKSAVDYKNIVL